MGLRHENLAHKIKLLCTHLLSVAGQAAPRRCLFGAAMVTSTMCQVPYFGSRDNVTITGPRAVPSCQTRASPQFHLGSSVHSCGASPGSSSRVCCFVHALLKGGSLIPCMLACNWAIQLGTAGLTFLRLLRALAAL